MRAAPALAQQLAKPRVACGTWAPWVLGDVTLHHPRPCRQQQQDGDAGPGAALDPLQLVKQHVAAMQRDVQFMQRDVHNVHKRCGAAVKSQASAVSVTAGSGKAVHGGHAA